MRVFEWIGAATPSLASLPLYLLFTLLGMIVFYPAIVYTKAIPSQKSFLTALREWKSVRISDLFLFLLGGISGLLSALKYGATVYGLLTVFFFAALLAIGIIDQRTMEIPDRFSVFLLLLGLISLLPITDMVWYERIIGAFAVSLPLLLITLLVPGAFGGGDIKMMVGAGLFLGWKHTVVAALLAILVGGSYGIYLLAARKKGKKDEFAFGPFLCFGILLSILFGHFIIDNYTEAFKIIGEAKELLGESL